MKLLKNNHPFLCGILLLFILTPSQAASAQQIEMYLYDANGNLSKDRSKGIDTIEYNHQNLVTNIVKPGEQITYSYNAMGTRQ